MDKVLAREFVKKVGPLEHSRNAKDRRAARQAELRLFRLLQTIPETKAAQRMER